MIWLLVFIVVLLFVNLGFSFLHLKRHNRTKEQQNFIREARRIMKGDD